MTVDHPATLPVKGTLVSLLDRIADRIHAQGDAAARAQGLTVTRLPGGRRSVSHPDLPALLEARRRNALAHGLDRADRALMDPATREALAMTARADRPPLRLAA
ncbi:MAG TPA: hypothetical protein VFG35_04295 [Actinoplanes sp.]|nr:hypothetical protein [Actinoplanes sp.]